VIRGRTDYKTNGKNRKPGGLFNRRNKNKIQQPGVRKRGIGDMTRSPFPKEVVI
jgi:hypothetical protein